MSHRIVTSSARRLRNQMGATMVSVMLLSVSLMTAGMLVVRSSIREVEQAGQLVARERALMVAQAAADLAAAQYLRMGNTTLDDALTGQYPQGADCTDPCSDCIPDALAIVTGQRNEILSGSATGCGGRPCMRQGAVSVLQDDSAAPVPWCDLPFRQLVQGGDAEARVSVWVRNNSADALGPNGSTSWTNDLDGRVVVTAMAVVRNTTVTVEQELVLTTGAGPGVLQPQSADEGYGGGHNNDNSAVSVCSSDFVQADQAAPAGP